MTSCFSGLPSEQKGLITEILTQAKSMKDHELAYSIMQLGPETYQKLDTSLVWKSEGGDPEQMKRVVTTKYYVEHKREIDKLLVKYWQENAGALPSSVTLHGVTLEPQAVQPNVSGNTMSGACSCQACQTARANPQAAQPIDDVPVAVAADDEDEVPAKAGWVKQVLAGTGIAVAGAILWALLSAASGKLGSFLGN